MENKGKQITIRVGDAYHNNQRGIDEVIINAEGHNDHPIVGAARFWFAEDRLHIAYCGTTAISDYDLRHKLRSFSKDEVIEGTLRGTGYYDPGTTEEERVEAREHLSRGIDEAGLEKIIRVDSL